MEKLFRNQCNSGFLNQQQFWRKYAFSLILIGSLIKIASSSLVNVTEVESPYLTVYSVSKNYSDINELLDFNLTQKFEKETVWFRNSKLALIPRYLFKVFSNVTDLSMTECGIKVLKQADFVGGNRLLKLDLGNNEIRAIPGSTFVLLTNLRRLDLGENRLTVLVPDTFYGLSELRDLFLDKNSIKTLPPNVFSPLTSLQDISLNGNPIRVLDNDVFKNNDKLEEIFLHECGLKQVGEEVFQHLKALRILNIARNSFDKLYLPALKILHAYNANLKECHINGSVRQAYIENNRIKTLTIANLSLTEELSIRNNSISDLSIFRAAKNLKKLDASNNPIGSISSDSFRNMMKLSELELSNIYLYNIYHGTFADLRNLFLLDLSKNHISRLDASILASLKSLHVLYLEDNELTDFDFVGLEMARVRPRIYSLDGNKWSCEFIPHLIDYIETYRINVKFREELNPNCTVSE